jgi:hypothetical protein
VIELRALYCRTPGPFLQSWHPRLRSTLIRGRWLVQLEHSSDRQLTAIARINRLAKFPSHCAVCRHPITSRLDASGAGQPGRRLRLYNARKDTAGQTRWRYNVPWRVGRDGFERGYRDPNRFLVDSCGRRLRASPTRFDASFGRFA